MQNLRTEFLKNVKVVIVKVGSAILTTPTERGIKLNYSIMHSICEQLSILQNQGYKIILVSSGAVATGRNLLKSTLQDKLMTPEYNSLAAKQAIAAMGQAKLMHLYEQYFIEHGIMTAQILLTRDDLKDRKRFLNIRNTFSHLLAWGVIPIVNENDTVSVNELKFSDNDNLASLLLNAVEADLFVNLTSIGCVLDKNPLKYSDAKPLKYIEDVSRLDLDELCGGKSSVGTGGMYSKLLAAHRAAQLGVPTLILNGQENDIILEAMKGIEHGTWVCQKEQNVSRRKYWLVYREEPQGKVYIDDGAAKALIEQGKSLLPVGISQVEGDFQVGDLVRIVYNDKNIGIGLINYNNETISKIKGLKRHEVAAVLGNALYPEAVHRDNLLLDAAM